MFDHFVGFALKRLFNLGDFSLHKTFHATSFFLYTLKTLDNQSFSYIFRGYRKRSAAGNEFSAFGSMFEANATTPDDHTFYEILIT